MRRLAGFGLVVVLAFVLAPLNTAYAVLDGEPDGNRHPYVGLVTDNNFVCSGALLAPTVFLTAAHCFEDPQQEVFVTFDPDGFYGDEPSAFYAGTWYPDPEFCIGCAPGLVGFDTHDVAVVILDEPLDPSVTLNQYAQLPTVGLVDTLPMRTGVAVVGYGIQDRLKDFDPGEAFTRYYAPAELIQSQGRISEEFLKVTANPAQGKGGLCFGDSGGPILQGTTILAVNSFVTNSNCAGVTYSYRIDTPEALAFINAIIDQYAH
jgi:hypothetical protein